MRKLASIVVMLAVATSVLAMLHNPVQAASLSRKTLLPSAGRILIPAEVGVDATEVRVRESMPSLSLAPPDPCTSLLDAPQGGDAPGAMVVAGKAQGKQFRLRALFSPDATVERNDILTLTYVGSCTMESPAYPPEFHGPYHAFSYTLQ